MTVGAGQGLSEHVGSDEVGAALGEAEFRDLVRDMVADEAPRLFAVVCELGERVDGWIAAWGLAFEESAEVLTVGGTRMSLKSPERATWMLGAKDGITAHLVWVEPREN